MSWEEEFRRNIERTRQRIMEIAPDMLDLKAHRAPMPSASGRGAVPRPFGRSATITHNWGSAAMVPETSRPDPARPGPYPTCASKSTIFHKHLGVPVSLIAYAPGTQISGSQCQSSAGNCPLVVIFHARPTGNVPLATYYLAYEPFARHLASYGFVVVSVGWGGVEQFAKTGGLLPPLLGWINGGNLGIDGIASGDLVLVGHSFGGEIADKSATPETLKGYGYKLRSVVLISPSYDDVVPSSFISSAPESVLVLHDVLDSDPGASGGEPGSKPVVTSAVRSYERAGQLEGTLNTSPPAFVKHLVYAGVNPADPDIDIPFLSHYYQNTSFSRGAVAAFLLGYVRNQTVYRQFFRRQLAVQGVTGLLDIEGTVYDGSSPPALSHMHAEPSELTVIDWNSPMASAVVQGEIESGIALLPDEDNWTLNHGLVLRVMFARGGLCQLTVTVDFSKITVGDYKFLSLAICQSNVAKEPLLGRVLGTVFISSTKSKSEFAIKLDDIGGFLVYRGDLTRRRVCMENLVLALDDIASEVDLSLIDRIRFEFQASGNPGKNAVILLGNMKLIGKGP